MLIVSRLTLYALSGALGVAFLSPPTTYAQEIDANSSLGGNLFAPAMMGDNEVDSTNFIIDERGYKKYIVTLKDKASAGFSKSFDATSVFPDYNKGAAVNFIKSFAADYGISVESVATWGTVMFTAYLTDQQLYSVNADSRVSAVEPDQMAKFSVDTTAVWTDSSTTLASPPTALWNKLVTQATEVQGWGKRAVNQSTTNSNGTPLVYIVDAGVSQHNDLNVVEWTNYSATYNCGTRVAGSTSCTAAALQTLVGCSTHATVVAGIIGAKANGTGVVGIDPSVPIVSVSSLTPSIDAAHSCNNGGSSAANIITALSWIMSDIVNHPGSRLRVVNISQNMASTALYNQMHSAATPTSSYPGAFIVQSAGNQFADACSYAYNGTSASDGILVVGAINNHGQPVVPLNGAPGFWKDAVDSANGHFVHEAGSNFGSCVEAWAPGDGIYSTFGSAVAFQNSGTISNLYGYGSGTSFAAPHIAGLAAYLLEPTLTITPGSLESTIRSHYSNLGSHAPQFSAFPPAANNFHVNSGGLAINLPTLNPVPAPNPKSTTYAELVMSTACGYPKWTSAPASPCSQVDYQNALYPPLPWATNGGIQIGWAPNNGTLSEPSGTPINILFDSYGSGSWTCDVSQSMGPAGSTIIDAGGQYYYNYHVVVPGSPVYSASCPSAAIANQHT